MSKLGDNVRLARKEKRWSQERLAIESGVKQGTISKIERGDQERTTFAVPLAAALGVTVDWLETGREPKYPIPLKTLPGEGLIPVAQSGRQIPVINYIQAGHPKEVVDDYAPGAGMESVTLYGEIAERCGQYCFALKVDGESMLPDFRPGDVVIIDPDVPHRPGDYVVAKLEREDAATLKKYRSRGRDDEGGEVFELVPLNDDYPTITVNRSNPGYVVGTVVEHHRKLK